MRSTKRSSEELFVRCLREQTAALPRPLRVICALSGGPDSTVLLLLLHRFAPELDLRLEAAYVNHGLREAGILEGEDRHVRELCASLNIPLYTKHLAPGFLDWYARRCGSGTEAAAREYRYRFFDRLLADGSGVMALGHNRNDQEETLVMRLFTGSSLQGLRGIPRSSDRIIRPLIDLERREIEAYLESSSVFALEDGSNSSDIYLRNRIRNRLMPVVREVFPAAGEALSALGLSTAEFLEHYESLLEQVCPLKAEKGRVSWNLEAFAALPPGVRRMTVLKGRNILLKGRGGSERIPASFLNPLDRPGGLKGGDKRVLLEGHGIRLTVKGERLLLEPVREPESPFFYHLKPGFPWRREGWHLRVLSLPRGGTEGVELPGNARCITLPEGTLLLRGDGRQPALLSLGERSVCRLDPEGIKVLKPFKIEKRCPAAGIEPLQCVIIEGERG